jgi:hypothetical protein
VKSDVSADNSRLRLQVPKKEVDRPRRPPSSRPGLNTGRAKMDETGVEKGELSIFRLVFGRFEEERVPHRMAEVKVSRDDEREGGGSVEEEGRKDGAHGAVSLEYGSGEGGVVDAEHAYYLPLSDAKVETDDVAGGDGQLGDGGGEMCGRNEGNGAEGGRFSVEESSAFISAVLMGLWAEP